MCERDIYIYIERDIGRAIVRDSEREREGMGECDIERYREIWGVERMRENLLYV